VTAEVVYFVLVFADDLPECGCVAGLEAFYEIEIISGSHGQYDTG
jgi:hypothetical protein